jgi:predicted AlkP superfamily pyrophosphatase or phosphodiesterase
MKKLYNSLPITGIAETITDIVGIDAPKQAEPLIEIICNSAKMYFNSKKVDRVFIYNPDAIALWLFQKYTALFEKAIMSSSIQVPLLSIMPTVTPACFASMYTGAMPDIHGIQAYEKPVVKTDTVFDAFIRAGLKPAIVSTADASLSCIFLEREMDYFIYDTHFDCNKKAMELIIDDKHDLIVLYNGNYDTTMHRAGTESNEAINELKSNIETYCELIKLIELHWSTHRTMVGFCPDHGCHEIDGNLGSHGLDMPEDMNIIHFYRFI